MHAHTIVGINWHFAVPVREDGVGAHQRVLTARGSEFALCVCWNGSLCLLLRVCVCASLGRPRSPPALSFNSPGGPTRACNVLSILAHGGSTSFVYMRLRISPVRVCVCVDDIFYNMCDVEP